MAGHFRLLVAGGGDWTDNLPIRSLIRVVHEHVATRGEGLTLVEGCARGADTIAEVEAGALGIAIEHHPADWAKFGRRAGPIRNKGMVRSGIDLGVFFGGGGGTANAKHVARRLSDAILIVYDGRFILQRGDEGTLARSIIEGLGREGHDTRDEWSATKIGGDW